MAEHITLASPAVTTTGCTIHVWDAPAHLGSGQVLHIRMDQPGDGRQAEVYLDPAALERLAVTLTAAVPAPAPEPEAKEFPFTRPEGSDVEMFIQWKGTDVCLDLHCPCGYHGHLDADFTYHVRCGGCGAIYEMGTQVIAKRVESPDAETQEHARTAVDLFA